MSESTTAFLVVVVVNERRPDSTSCHLNFPRAGENARRQHLILTLLWASCCLYTYQKGKKCIFHQLRIFVSLLQTYNGYGLLCQKGLPLLGCRSGLAQAPPDKRIMPYMATNDDPGR